MPINLSMASVIAHKQCTDEHRSRWIQRNILAIAALFSGGWSGNSSILSRLSSTVYTNSACIRWQKQQVSSQNHALLSTGGNETAHFLPRCIVQRGLGDRIKPSVCPAVKHVNCDKKRKIEITQCDGHCAVQGDKVIQGHRFWYQSKAHIRLPISD